MDPETGNTFIDETIYYYPITIFRMGKKIDNQWQWDNKFIDSIITM